MGREAKRRQAAKQLGQDVAWPLYRCNHIARALKITHVEQDPVKLSGVLSFGGGYPAWSMPVAFMNRWKPEAGDFCVRQEDGSVMVQKAVPFLAQFTKARQ